LYDLQVIITFLRAKKQAERALNYVDLPKVELRLFNTYQDSFIYFLETASLSGGRRIFLSKTTSK